MKPRIASLPHLLLPLSLLVFAACGARVPQTTVLQAAQEPARTQVIGEGRLSAAPEYIELMVTVHSECFDTPAAASAATDQAAAQVMALLAAMTDESKTTDGVFSRGGVTQQFSRYVGNRLTCRGTFKKSATITMKTTRVKDFPGEFARVQQAILSGTLRKPTTPRANAGSSYATIQTPVPRLTHESRERLEKQALAAAVQSARSKFTAAAQVACKDARHRIVKFVEHNPSAGRPISYAGTRASSASGQTIAFESIWINKLLEVHFEFAGQRCASAG